VTRQDQVLRMLTVGWVCGTQFEDEHVADYETRINQLRQAGHLIHRRPCQRHRHQSREYEWRLLAALEVNGVPV
jgi:hypothetical protein